MGRRELRLLAALLWSRSATCLLPRPLPPTRSLEASILESYSQRRNDSSRATSTAASASPFHHPLVVGVDEAGTGAIAGPIVAAAVWLDESFDETSELASFDQRQLDGSPEPPPLTASTRLHDSKLLNATERRSLWLRLRGSSRIVWATGAATARRVDDVGVSQANGEAMAIAVDRLSRRLAVRGIIASSSGRELSILVDGDVVPDALLTVDDDDDDGDGPFAAEAGKAEPNELRVLEHVF
jgi:hypothetical protein